MPNAIRRAKGTVRGGNLASSDRRLTVSYVGERVDSKQKPAEKGLRSTVWVRRVRMTQAIAAALSLCGSDNVHKLQPKGGDIK